MPIADWSQPRHSARMPYDGGSGLEGGLKVIGFMGAAVFLGAALFLGPKPKPQPSSSLAYGCYTTPQAPFILLDQRGMAILQPGLPIMGFHLERQKTGIALTSEAPISANSAGNGYSYSIDKRGIGTYLSFYKIIDGRSYGVFDETDLNAFQMLAMNGQYLTYRKAELDDCAKTGRLASAAQSPSNIEPLPSP